MRRRARRVFLGWVWSAARLVASRRRLRFTRADAAGLDFRTQTRGMGLRMSEWLRDRLRPRWLRLRRPEQ